MKKQIKKTIVLNIADCVDNETFEEILNNIGVDRFDNENKPIQSITLTISDIELHDF